MEVTSSVSQQSTDLRTVNFHFTGKGSEYFKIWIVNIFLSILTLGIYSAWAKVRNKNYFYSNTFLDHTSFEYTAKPTAILKGRIIAVIFFMLYQTIASFAPAISLILALGLLLLSPWVIINTLSFNARNSKYRNITFRFSKDYKSAFLIFTLLPITVPFSLGLTLPYMLYRIKKFIVSNHFYGNTSFNFSLKNSKQFYIIFGKAACIVVLFAIMTKIIYTLSLPLTLPKSNNGSESIATTFVIFNGIIIPLVGFMIYILLFGFINSQVYNITYQHASIAKHTFCATMKTKKLAWIYLSNTLGILCTLGLFIPWAKVRTARYRAECTHIQVSGDLNHFIASKTQQLSALGEEVGDFFDIDIGI